MASVIVKSEPLGLNLQLNSDFELSRREIWDTVRNHDPSLTSKLLKKWKRNQGDPEIERLALDAYNNKFFESQGTFTEGFGTMAGSVAQGVTNMVKTSITSGDLRRQAGEYDDVELDPQFASKFKKPINEAAKTFIGYTDSDPKKNLRAIPFGIGNLLNTGPVGELVDTLTTPSAEENIKKSLEFAGLEDSPTSRKAMMDRVLELDTGRTDATRGQAAIEAWAMSAVIGAKGKEYLDLLGPLGGWNLAKRISDNPEYEKENKLKHLNFLYEADKIAHITEEGAETAALLGGAKGVLSKFATAPFGGDSMFDPDTKTLAELKAGNVAPDRDQAIAMSIPMSPDIWLTIGATGALKGVQNAISRGAIGSLSKSASEEAAFRATIDQLSEIQNRTALQNTLLQRAEDGLRGVAGSTAKLEGQVAKNSAVAEQVLMKSDVGAGMNHATNELIKALQRVPGPNAPVVNRLAGAALEKAGVSAEFFGKTLELLHRIPEETLVTLFEKSIGEPATRALWKTAAGGTAAYAGTGGFEQTPSLESLALALVLMPGGHKVVTRVGTDAAIIGARLQEGGASRPLFQRIAETSKVDPKFAEAIVDRTTVLKVPEAIGQLKDKIFSPSRVFDASPLLKTTSNFLTDTGFGNTLAGAANLTKQTIGAASFPAALGYAIGGEEGAGAALGASVGPMLLGIGSNQLARFSDGEVRRKMVGDLALFEKEYMAPGQKEIFQSYPKRLRHAIATAAQNNPDVEFVLKKGSRAAYHEIVDGKSVITLYEKSAPESVYSALLGHEIGHHIDSHGFGVRIKEELLGNVEKQKPGAFTEYDSQGRPIIRVGTDGSARYKNNMEFRATHEDVQAGRADRIGHRQRYLDLIEQQFGKESAEYRRYASDEAQIAKEIFASQTADYYFGGNAVKGNYQGAGSKILNAISSRILDSGFIKTFLDKIGMATDESNGLVLDPTGLFPGLKKSKTLDKIIKQYNDEVRGLDAEGRQAWAARRGGVVDSSFADEFVTSDLSAQDLANPAIAERLLKEGGHLSINPDGSIKLDASGRPVFIPTREVNKNNKALSNDILEIIRQKEDAGESFQDGHLTLEATADGSLRASGRFLDPSIIRDLRSLDRYSKHQLDALEKINESLRNDTGDTWNLFYYSALKWNKAGRKVYGQIKGGDRHSLPFGLTITKDGNVIIETISIDAFRKNLDWLSKSKGWGQKMQDAFGGGDPATNANLAFDLLPTYLENHTRGRPNIEANGVKEGQRDFINAALGRVRKQQAELNPILKGLGDRRSQRQQAIRSRRLDRVGNAIQDFKIGVYNPDPVAQNQHPRFMPQMELDFSSPQKPAPGKPNFWKIYRIDPNSPKVYDEVADVLIWRGSPWMDGSIVESKAANLNLDPGQLRQAMSRAHRRWEGGGGKQFMPTNNRPLGLSDNIRDGVLPNIRQDTFSRSQLEAALGKTAGAKAYAEEIGLMNWLKDRKSVTKAEVDQFVRENAPRLEEKRLSGPPEGEEVSLREQNRTRSENGEEVIEIDAEGDYFTMTIDEDWGNVYVQGNRGQFLELDAPINRQTEQDGWRAIEDHYREKQGAATKYSEYQEPGGTNYREVLVKLPEESANNSEIQALRQEKQSILEKRQALEAEGKYWESNALSPEMGAINSRIRKLQSQDNFKDPHFNENNVLLHLRLNDRIDADGKKVLFIEELQSDWHQKGRKEGYATNLGPLSVSKQEGGFYVTAQGGVKTVDGPFPTLDHARAVLSERSELGKVPDAPFKKNWPALGLKRVIKEALEGGYDRIAWLDGEGQAARYDLSKHVDSIVHMKNKDGTYDVEVISGNSVEVSKNNQSPRQLEELVGKEVAQKITEGKGGKPDDYPGGWKELSGLDLKVGGEGMKAFYDRELVSIANKISKKIGGGKVRRETRLEAGLDSQEFGSHVLDLPKNPQAVENLKLFMPVDKALSDSRAPAILRGKQFMPATGNRGTFDAGEGNILFMPQSNAIMAKAGEVITLPEESLRLYMPASPDVNLADYANRKIFALTTDRMGIGQMSTGPKGKKKPIGKEAQGGRGFTQIYNGGGWAFSTKDAAERFITRVGKVAGKDDSALVGLTALADVNHLKSQYGQLAYANALRAAVETGTISQKKADAHLSSIMSRILESKAKKAPKGKNRETIASIKTLADFEKAVKEKKINFAMADLLYGKAKQKTLPISEAEALEFGLDLESIARDIADPELASLEGFGQVVGLLEISKNQQPVKSDFHYSYPYVVEGKRIGFLKNFIDVGDLTSNPKIRDKTGKVSAQPLQTVMPEFDRLQNMQFMPTDPKAPNRQPANQVQSQNQSMPGNRFMAPPSTAKGELSEIFRQ